MTGIFEDLTGQRFGRLVVIERVENGSNYTTRWRCLCDCGNETITTGKRLKNGTTKSCGCLQEEYRHNHEPKFIIHGDSYSSLYRSWSHMKSRCNDINNTAYENYGGRGITVCDDWNEYLSFKQWALENGYEEGLTIDRINNDGNYEPNNCRWATRKQQQNNRRCSMYYCINGESHTLPEWCEIYGINHNTVLSRINRGGWPVIQAITTPLSAHYCE